MVFFTAVVMVQVYTLFSSKGVTGTKETVLLAYDSAPAIVVLPCLTIKLLAVSVAEFIGTEKVAVIVLFSATPVALSIGLVEVTVGAASVMNVQE